MIAVVGAGAAGLMAAIHAARGGARVVALDGARKLGAKILVAGGGRCNVTHHRVDERAFAGSTAAAIRKVLRRFDVPETVAFFKELGVELKREATGKLFPVSDDARTVLEALLGAARDAGVELRHPARVTAIEPGFVLRGPFGELRAERVIVCTGGKALPKSGSDGLGLELVRRLGHTLTPLITPALVPLTLAEGCFVRQLSGLTLVTTIEVRAGSGKKLASFTDSTLCTHFGLSGPSVLDASRYFLHARAADPEARLVIDWLPAVPDLDARLQELEATRVSTFLSRHLPDRLAQALCAEARVPATTPGGELSRQRRRELVRLVSAHELPVTGDRGFTHAEVTAGGVPLSELELATLESRRTPGLYLAGEICDVDGRIGGFNFQWAWASGYVAGTAACSGLETRAPEMR